MQEIGDSVGYGDLAFFRQLFQRHAGISPVPTGEASGCSVLPSVEEALHVMGTFVFHSSESCDHPDRKLKAVFIEASYHHSPGNGSGTAGTQAC